MIRCLSGLCLVGTLACWGCATAPVVPEVCEACDEAAADRFFEMRIYTANEGKLEALNQRFRDHTNRLFVKHGMELVGYWTPTDPARAKDTLVYILAYPSLEARQKSWADFMNDPEWKAAFEASHKDGVLVKGVESKFLSPTDYSPIR